MSEKDFQRQVIDLAHILGWAVYHPWLSKFSERGWPDLAIVKPPRLVLAELKTEKGKLTEHQVRWVDLLTNCAGVEVYVWRPSQLHGEIVQALRGPIC
jgi:hypothetical protein